MKRKPQCREDMDYPELVCRDCAIQYEGTIPYHPFSVKIGRCDVCMVEGRNVTHPCSYGDPNFPMFRLKGNHSVPDSVKKDIEEFTRLARLVNKP